MKRPFMRQMPAKKPLCAPPATIKSPSNFPREMRGILILSLSMLALLAHLSFRFQHPEVNWLGLAGYGLAYSSLYLFGITAYLVNGFCFWIGWRCVVGKKIENLSWRCVHLGIAIASLCLLFNLAAETHPKIGALLKSAIHSESIQMPAPYNYRKIRYHLGGAPLYYLYRDLPLLSMQHIFSNVGTFLVSSTILLVSMLQLLRTKIFGLLEKSVQKWSQGRPQRPAAAPAMTMNPPAPPPLRYPPPPPKAPLPPPQALAIKPRPLQTLRERLKERMEKITPIESKISVASPRPIPNALKTPLPATPLNKRESALKAQSLANGDMKHFTLPPVSLLQDPKVVDQSSLKKDLRRQAEILEETLLSFGIEAKVGHIQCGPTVTAFEVHPAIGVKVQKIKALENDIALNLKAQSIRIIAPIPGKAAVGVEVPNPIPQEVSFKEMLATYQQSGRKAHIPVLLGKVVSGEDLITDLSRMPHLIIAGATGSGKSVCINTIVMSIVMNAKPDEVKLLMVDPKKVELTAYSKLPHMLAPVITESHGAHAALSWLVKEMERRYEWLKHVGQRNITGFNHRPASSPKVTPGGAEIPAKLSYIVAIIDELADLMMVSSQDIETPIARIAQMARAVGIHLIIATQRPSREVITGLIKANFPTRIAFKVASRINSQIILDETGAESLLGNGDMLFLPPGSSQLLRAQGAYLRDEDINRIVENICNQAPAQYLIPSFDNMNYAEAMGEKPENSAADSLYESAMQIVVDAGFASTTFLQRKLKIGYARAASIMDELFQNGVIGPQEGSKPRRVLHKNGKKDSEDFDGE